MAKSKSCPKGTICLSTETICVFTVIVILALCVYIYYLHHQTKSSSAGDTQLYSHTTFPNTETEPDVEVTQKQHHHPSADHLSLPQNASSAQATHSYALTNRTIPQHIPNVTTNIFQSSNYADPLLRPPLRLSPNTTRMNLMPINIETRGTTPDMQQVGTLRNKNNDNILALYGRPTYRGSSKWLYYTATDKFHSIKLPIEKNNRNCTSEYGCDELYEDDEVRVKGYDGMFHTSIYQLDTPRYIPYVG